MKTVLTLDLNKIAHDLKTTKLPLIIPRKDLSKTFASINKISNYTHRFTWQYAFRQLLLKPNLSYNQVRD